MRYNREHIMNSSIDPKEQALVSLEIAMDHARKLGASSAEAALSTGGGLSVTVRNGELESIEHHQDKALSLTVYHGKRKGTATTTDFSPRSIESTVAAANRIAQHAEADPHAGLIDPSYLAQDIPDLDLDHPWDVTPEEATELAIRCDSAARDFDSRVDQIDDVSVSQHRGTRGYASSDGFAQAYSGSRHSLSCIVVGKHEQTMQRGYWYTLARNASELAAPEAVGIAAADRTMAKLGARKVATEKVPVIFEAPIASGLVGHLVSAISGGNLYRKASFLVDCAGRTIFPNHLSIMEAPHLVRGLGSAPFDAEGAKTSARNLVDHGVLTGYVLGSYSARRLNLPPTGNAGGVHNLSVSHQDLSFEQLVAQMGRGLIVTSLMGFGINMVTGDYSRGASGFWVEDGAIAFPVEEITIAGNLSEIFKNIVTCAADVDRRGNIHTGSMLIESLTVAGS
ncbi:MAG: PmbA protein [Gammaproteobacteria bacterium]|jgi:PmbA protein